MGLSIDTLCKTCKKTAPWLADGEGGFIGELSLSVEPRNPPMGPQNLGYILAAFQGVGALTHDWKAFREFVQAHSGHALVTSTNGDAQEEGEEYEEVDPDDDDFDEVPDGWIYAPLEAECRTCGQSFVTENAEMLPDKAQQSISSEAIGALQAVLPGLPDNLYRSEPFVEIAPLATFLAEHSGHDLVTRTGSEQE